MRVAVSRFGPANSAGKTACNGASSTTNSSSPVIVPARPSGDQAVSPRERSLVVRTGLTTGVLFCQGASEQLPSIVLLLQTATATATATSREQGSALTRCVITAPCIMLCNDPKVWSHVQRDAVEPRCFRFLPGNDRTCDRSSGSCGNHAPKTHGYDLLGEIYFARFQRSSARGNSRSPLQDRGRFTRATTTTPPRFFVDATRKLWISWPTPARPRDRFGMVIP